MVEHEGDTFVLNHQSRYYLLNRRLEAKLGHAGSLGLVAVLSLGRTW